MKNQNSRAVKKIGAAVIAALLIIVLAAVICFRMNHAVIDTSRGLLFLNIQDTTKITYTNAKYEIIVNQTSELKRLKNLRSLILNVYPDDDLGFLKDFNSLEDLYLAANNGVLDRCNLDTLPAMPQLRSLGMSIFDDKQLDCSVLGQLTSLEELDILSCNIHDWSFTEKLPYLRSVSISLNGEDRNGFEWDTLRSARSLEEFSAVRVLYDKKLLDALESLPSIRKVILAFDEGEGLPESDRLYLDEWVEIMKNKGVSVSII